jgi:hypothetical protein
LEKDSSLADKVKDLKYKPVINLVLTASKVFNSKCEFEKKAAEVP